MENNEAPTTPAPTPNALACLELEMSVTCNLDTTHTITG